MEKRLQEQEETISMQQGQIDALYAQAEELTLLKSQMKKVMDNMPAVFA
jgi:hypothetical protein